MTQGSPHTLHHGILEVKEKTHPLANVSGKNNVVLDKGGGRLSNSTIYIFNVEISRCSSSNTQLHTHNPFLSLSPHLSLAHIL